MSDLGELIVKILENGITLSTLIAAIVVLFKYREQHRIYRMLYLIGEKVGIEWKSSLHTNGFVFMPRQLSKKLSSYSPMVMRHLKTRRKKRMILASISKKLTALILALGVATLNKKLGLDLSVPEVVTYIISTLGYILIQGHVDGKKAAAVNTVINTLQAAANDPIAYDPNTTHQDVIKMANLSISTFNDMLKALKMNDNSAAYKTSATYFAEWKQVTDRYTPIVPLPAIPEQKVS